MKTFTAALLLAATNAHPGNHSHPHNIVPDHIKSGAVKASNVCVDNDAGFVLYFYFDDLVTGDVSAHTDKYPID